MAFLPDSHMARQLDGGFSIFCVVFVGFRNQDLGMYLFSFPALFPFWAWVKEKTGRPKPCSGVRSAFYFDSHVAEF